MLLVGKVFRMHERHVEEDTPLLGDLLVELALDRFPRDRGGDVVAGKGARCPRNMLRGNWSNTMMAASAWSALSTLISGAASNSDS